MVTTDNNVENLEMITTRRLRLHRPLEQDADEMYKRYASDATVTKLLSWPTHSTVEDTRQFIQTYSNVLWNKYKVGPYLISDLESGKLLGSTGLDFISNDDGNEGCASTGYVLAQDSWGQGYATEVLEAMILLARRLQIKELVAECHANHVVSQHILAKCGFVLVEDNKKRAIVFPNLGTGEPQPILKFVYFIAQD